MTDTRFEQTKFLKLNKHLFYTINTMNTRDIQYT